MASGDHPEGAQTWESPAQFFFTYQTLIPLDAFQGIVVAYVLLYRFFIQTHCGSTVSTALEMLPRYPLVAQLLPVDPNHTLPIDNFYRKRNAMFRRNA